MHILDGSSSSMDACRLGSSALTNRNVKSSVQVHASNVLNRKSPSAVLLPGRSRLRRSDIEKRQTHITAYNTLNHSRSNMSMASGYKSWFDRRNDPRESSSAKPAGPHPQKGMKGGACNRTTCQKPAEKDRSGIRWFNHSTQKYYCFGCAWELNTDKFNRQESLARWGHDLCTLESE